MERGPERIPPHSMEAEQSVLGAMLIDRDAIAKVMERLLPEDFYREAHKEIFTAIRGLFERGEPVDVLSVAEELRRRGKLEEVGGISYLQELVELVPTTAHVDYYAKVVEEKAIQRELIAAATEVVQMAYGEVEDIDDLVDRAEERLFRVGQRRLSEGFVPIKPILRKTFDEIDRMYHRQKPTTGIPTGFEEFDERTSGLQPSDLIVIAGRPAMGKTSFALNIAEHVAVEEKIPVAIFSLEMSKEQVVQRLLCSRARVDSHKLRTGKLGRDDWRRLAEALEDLYEAPIFIDDSPTLTVLEMRAKARRLKAEHGLGLIIVDYLQLVKAPGKFESRHQEISEVARQLKGLARELNVPLVALSQLSRAVEKRENRRPILSDLRESGSIEAEADLVAFLYREDYYPPKDEERRPEEPPEAICEVIIAKQRNGPTGTFELLFQRNFARFENIEKERVR